jgi:hypothetical protein
MSEPKKAVALEVLARLHPIDELAALTVEEAGTSPQDDTMIPFEEVLGTLPNSHLAGDVGLHFEGRFEYADALAIEVARQLHDDSGVPLREGLRIASYTGAVSKYFDHRTDHGDFWIAVAAARNDWGDGDRGKTHVTSFGPNEFWSTMHFAGAFENVAGDINGWMMVDAREYGAMPARIIMANVSTADRRLRKRADDLGIKITGNAFA